MVQTFKPCPTVCATPIEVIRSVMGQQLGFISAYYKAKSIGQWGKFLVMVMGFVDHCRFLVPGNTQKILTDI